jgi:hypothetical protein
MIEFEIGINLPLHILSALATLVSKHPSLTLFKHLLSLLNLLNYQYLLFYTILL